LLTAFPTFNFQLSSRIILIKKKPQSANHQTTKSSNQIAAPFLLKSNLHQHPSIRQPADSGQRISNSAI
jgi:hypothetical protein